MMLKHGPVGEVHFFHWYVNVIGNEPVQVPFDTDRKSPMFGAPVVFVNGSVITGYAVLTGGLTVPASVTMPVGGGLCRRRLTRRVRRGHDDAERVSRCRQRRPRTSTLVPPVATQPFPAASQRCH